MGAGARTPEELEALFEDAAVLGDRSALAGLFEDGAVLATNDRQARGEAGIAGLAASMWARGHLYLADPHRVVQARDTALVVAERAVNVVRRAPDGAWRYAVSLLLVDPRDTREES